MTGPEYFFYHLEGQPLQEALPLLLEKTLARGWRACVRCSSQERLDALDSALWTYRDDSFLPHGTSKDGSAQKQPILLTLATGNPNGAHALFLIEDADEEQPEQYARVVRLFDGGDETAKATARLEWSAAKARGSAVSYWQQNGAGSWTKSG